MGWKLFAGIMIIIVGTFNVIDGLVAITNANYFKNVGGGSIAAAADEQRQDLGLGRADPRRGPDPVRVPDLRREHVRPRDRCAGRGANAIVQLAYLPHYPLWSFTMILVDILVIWGIVVHGGRLMADA